MTQSFILTFQMEFMGLQKKRKKKAKGIHQYFWYLKHQEGIGMERHDVLTNIIWDLNL